MNVIKPNLIRLTLLILTAISLSACSGSDDGSEGTTDGGTSTGIFSIEPVPAMQLEEGDGLGVNIPVILTRLQGHSNTITLSIEGVQDSDDRLITFTYAPAQLPAGQSVSTINARLAIDDLPIMPQQRRLTLRASDGIDSASIPVVLNITPVQAPDVYLLAGQSNMVGFSGDGTKLSNLGGPDEPNPRILQLNVTKNDQWEIFNSESAFVSSSTNVISEDPIVQAEDPLHIPLDPNNTSGKDLSYIGMGLTFAKAALNNTTQNIVLVPTAWSGSAFCDNFDGPIGQWNAQDTPDPNLGNTWLYDRAIARTNLALQETNGILRGILWHQGESDANDRCASSYLSNLERLAQQLRLNIDQDRRGGALRRASANVPFVLGTMSRGVDERADLSEFWPDKQKIDDAHRTLPSKIAHAAVTITDDITPANGYPCGNTTCIHYGAAALREMGERYYQALIRAVATP